MDLRSPSPAERSGGGYFASMRRIVDADRTGESDAQLGMVLTFIAGAINAGGFLAVGQYTSHMSGIFSAMADNAALGAFGLVGLGLGAFLPFIAGAACSAVLINWGRRHHSGIQYALPIMLEALLLCLFGVIGALFYPSPGLVLSAVPLLCFIMGLQNATVTKLSGARIRTTHVTGLVTDLGIEFGKLLFWNRSRDERYGSPVIADRPKMRLLSLLLGSFFVGGIIGALGFSHLGFLFALPLAALLFVIAVPTLANAPGAQERQ
ncbi:YoaK family protein [Microvirga brassicacearum]